MKKYLQGKKAGISILAALAIISLAEVVMRSVILQEAMFNLSNAGEPVITALVSLLLMIFAIRGKDRVVYILGGAWLGYFGFKQLFGMPAMISTFFAAMKHSEGFTDYAILIHVVSMVCIVILCGLLVEYMNDGTIYNKAFNILCLITALTFVVNILFAVYDMIVLNDTPAVLAILNNLSRAAMLFFFVFFAYNSAKAQLKKVNFSK